MKRKLFAFVLAFLMLAGLMAGCGNQEKSGGSDPGTAVPASPAGETPLEEPASSEDLPPADALAVFPESENARLSFSNDYSLPLCQDTATLSFMRTNVNLMGELSTVGIETFNDFDYIKELEAKTNVHVDFHEISFFDAAEVMGIAISSGELTDLIADLIYTGGPTGALADDIILDLTDLVAEYAPNYTYMINSNADETSAFKVNGRILYLASPYDNFMANQGMVVRTDWLEQVGMEMPATYDDMYEVLTAFKTEFNSSATLYMNSDCVITSLSDGYNIAAFGAGGMEADLPYFVDKGVVKCSLLEDGYREYLRMVNKWYQEGLFSSDFVSVVFDPFSDYLPNQISSGQMGVWATSTEGIDRYGVPIAPISNPVKQAGDMDHVFENSLLVDSSDTYVTTSCENVELALKWLDYWYSVDGVAMYNYGLEGIDYSLDANGTPVFTEAIINNEFGLPVSNYMRVRCGYGVFSSVLLRFRTYEYNSDLAKAAWDTWTSNIDGSMCIDENLALTAEGAETSRRYVGDILTYACETVPKFVMGEMSFDEWDGYIDRLISMNIEDCIAAKQEAYDLSVG